MLIGLELDPALKLLILIGLELDPTPGLRSGFDESDQARSKGSETIDFYRFGA